MSGHTHLRATLSVGALALAMLAAAPAFAEDDTSAATVAETAPANPATNEAAADSIVVTAKSTRSATAITSSEIQKILPGVSAFKAIQTLPGVLYITADPWGNNEQNASLFIHGFSAGQLGYTMDGVPLGDQNYGNFNGLSPQRAVISENIGRTTVTTGAGDLGIASTSNLGGAVEVFSSDPKSQRGIDIDQTVGSYGTSRTFIRIDTGQWGENGGSSAYISAARQRSRAWDFNGRQGGWQANAKYVHDDSTGKLTFFFDYSDKTEPNEDATTIYLHPSNAAQAYQPYTRPFLYPDFGAAQAYIDSSGNLVDQTQSVNYRNYYSDAQRTDYLTYLKYDAHLSDKVTWSNQVYLHHDDGVGVVAGALLFVWNSPVKYYYPGYTQATLISSGIDNSGYIVRTTEYRIDRKGLISNLDIDLGAHQIEIGGWFQHNSSAAYRRWYALDANNPQNYSPYIRPSNPLFTQYGAEMRDDALQFHMQDNWKLTPRVTVEVGFKTSAQYANGWFPVQPVAGSLPGASSALPSGRINTENWFLPSIGAKWDANGSEQLYFNIQKNMRQYQAYGGGGSADPWSTSSQATFDYIKNNGHPETSWTYEVGLRSHRNVNFGLLTAIEAQVNYYHVDFSNRLLAVSAAPGGIAGGAISGGSTSLFNVGGVKTDGVDAAFTFRFGRHFSIYNAASYNNSTYQSDYSTSSGGATGSCMGGVTVTNNIVPTCDKQVAGSPKWMDKSVVSLNYGAFEAQFIGDYVGKRYATYVNDASVPSYFLGSLRLAYQLPAAIIHARKAELSVNVTNLFQERGWSSVSINQSGSFSAYPIAPRQWFATLSLGF